MSRTGAILAVGIAALVGACRPAVIETGPAPTAATQPAPIDASAIPMGTLLETRLNHTLGTEHSQVGDRFTVTTTHAIVARTGELVVPEGATLTGVVTALQPSRSAGEPALIRVNFESIQLRDRTLPVAAEVVDTDVRVRHMTDPARAGVAGAVAGAVLGAVLRGATLDNIVLGAALGAAAGTVISLGLGDVAAEIPAGTAMTVQINQPVPLR
jgi:hypothetical protein